MLPRRQFLHTTTAGAAALAFLSRLPSVSAAEAKVDPSIVRFHPDIEPLVRLLEDTPQDRVLEEVATRILHHGLKYPQVLAALMLAGVRNIQPRPVGFKFHAVLVVNSAHLASLASPDSDRWLPIFWAIDQFKSSQAADVREGNWTMGLVDESAVPASHLARKAFTDAMDRWDEAAADTAVVGLARSGATPDELFEIFCRYGARDFRDIGHKAIYVANSFRTLDVIGWQHAEPVLRSLAYALLDRSGAKENPATADLPADRPFRQNLELIGRLGEGSGWATGGAPNAEATRDLLQTLRTGSASDLGEYTATLLSRKDDQRIAPQSIFDALFDGAGELLMRAPGIVSLHAMTFTNAIHYAWRRSKNDETRRLLLLQNAAFLPLYRGDPRRDLNQDDKSGIRIDSLDPLPLTAKIGAGETSDGAVAEIFSDIGANRLTAARKILGLLQDQPAAVATFANTARRLVFLKGTNSHDYKFCSAVLEDYEHLSPAWRPRLLAASAFYFRGSAEKDNTLVRRTRSALSA